MPVRRTARLAGVAYLLVALLGGFAQFFARGSVHVPGDAAETAANVARQATLFRLGLVADLLMATSFLVLGLALYLLFRDVHRVAAHWLLVLVAVGAGMILVNLVLHAAALLVATEPAYAAGAGAAASDTLVLLFLDLHQTGYLICGILFGLWLLPLGYLARVSGWFPRPLAVLLQIAGAGYLINTLAAFLLPELDPVVATVVTAPAVAGELWMIGYLLLIGVFRAPPSRVSGTRPGPGPGEESGRLETPAVRP